MTRADYNEALPRRPANFQPLTPLSYLARAAAAFPDHPAVIHGRQRYSYATFHDRCRRLASALVRRGIGVGDTVSALLMNTPPMLEAHHGVPMPGAVLHAINTRLDPAAIAFQLEHAQSRLLIFDSELAPLVAEALRQAREKPFLVIYRDPELPPAAEGRGGPELDAIDYEAFLAGGDADFAWRMPADEWDAISLNYTSGTTGNPKGVVYHHRGAALMCTANALAGNLGRHPVYLWTLPMFHCNGWCFPWTLSAVGGTHVCLRAVRAGAIYAAIAEHRVTHLCGAPIVMATLINASEAEKRPFTQRVTFMTAAAPPPEAVLAAMASAGFAVTHVYGLTETYGPAVVNEWKEEWDALDGAGQAAMKARQGVRYPALEALAVLDPATLEPVAADGETLGEVFFRGNIVMKGYLRNPAATEEAFRGGWFHSGDLGVMHADGYVQLKDRSKDIIISGGENISSIEVEDALYKHAAVAVAAVVAKPDPTWGESPCAFVELKPGASATAEELIAHARRHIAAYKCPRTVVFAEIPRTSTGKIQKFRLRERAKDL